MIGPMPKRSVVAAALLAASLSSLAAAARLYLWPGAQVPLLLPAPAAPPATEPNLAYPVTTRSVEVRPGDTRSEEHTSELQSLRHLVCRLLLEKKKNNQRKAEHIIEGNQPASQAISTVDH